MDVFSVCRHSDLDIMWCVWSAGQKHPLTVLFYVNTLWLTGAVMTGHSSRYRLFRLTWVHSSKFNLSSTMPFPCLAKLIKSEWISVRTSFVVRQHDCAVWSKMSVLKRHNFTDMSSWPDSHAPSAHAHLNSGIFVLVFKTFMHSVICGSDNPLFIITHNENNQISGGWRGRYWSVKYFSTGAAVNNTI